MAAPPCLSRRLSIAPLSSGAAQTVRVTHPFHPFCGRTFELLNCRFNWGEYRVQMRDEAGRVHMFPASWTDVGAPDPFVTLSAGRSAFRAVDLIELAALIDRVQRGQVATAAASVKGISPRL